MTLIKQFAEFLRENRRKVVREKDVLEPHWDPTYGQQDPTTTTIEYVDFDALCDAIDEFAATFDQKS